MVISTRQVDVRTDDSKGASHPNLRALLEAVVSIPVSIRWWVNGTRFVRDEPILMRRVHQDSTVLPPAWEFFRKFGGLSTYKDHFTRLAGDGPDKSWTAQFTQGRDPACCVQLVVPIRLTKRWPNLALNGEPEYSLIEGSVLPNGKFQVNPTGTQERLSQDQWESRDKTTFRSEPFEHTDKVEPRRVTENLGRA